MSYKLRNQKVQVNPRDIREGEVYYIADPRKRVDHHRSFKNAVVLMGPTRFVLEYSHSNSTWATVRDDVERANEPVVRMEPIIGDRSWIREDLAFNPNDNKVNTYVCILACEWRGDTARVMWIPQSWVCCLQEEYDRFHEWDKAACEQSQKDSVIAKETAYAEAITSLIMAGVDEVMLDAAANMLVRHPGATFEAVSGTWSGAPAIRITKKGDSLRDYSDSLYTFDAERNRLEDVLTISIKRNFRTDEYIPTTSYENKPEVGSLADLQNVRQHADLMARMFMDAETFVKAYNKEQAAA